MHLRSKGAASPSFLVVLEFFMNLSHFEPLNSAFVRAGENCILMASLRVSSAENHSLVKDVLCAALHCEQSVARLLLLSTLRGVALVHDHYQVWHP